MIRPRKLSFQQASPSKREAKQKEERKDYGKEAGDRSWGDRAEVRVHRALTVPAGVQKQNSGKREPEHPTSIRTPAKRPDIEVTLARDP